MIRHPEKIKKYNPTVLKKPSWLKVKAPTSKTYFETLDIVKEQKEAGAPPMIHPLVRTHPECGTRSIWFHKAKTENIIGMEPQETQNFLSELLEEAIRPEFTYTHEYTLGDMLIIDNRSSMHKAGFDYDHNQHRMLYRALVRGDKPF